MNFTLDNMNSLYLDVLKEIGNIGSGNAATSLSKMINKSVNMEVPNIEVVETEKVVELFDDEEEITVGVYINFNGSINGTILTLLDKESADNLVNILFGNKPKGDIYSEIESSVIQELGNIMSSGYVNSISLLTSLDINISVPSVNIDMVSSILSVPAIEYGLESDKLILIENRLIIDEEKIKCFFFFMPDLTSFDTLFKSLGVLGNG
ncbi:chemotaxis protein CheC [Acetoanaerobium pronyense]|uniref:Chemotaxis protein CheC n=1 Tax=Acetoanaerobium pronyense TaxID=1482736 RepID=A0ABS4KF83_9FIRM|nr:chemotaxis protein CheC [Acetoanaerobium pronyense]MBP2026422.1 chemotaxis protein CheC [Acetoanaerobium pronyense]